MSDISNEFCLPRRSFRAAVDAATGDMSSVKWTDGALRLLQSVSENNIVELFHTSELLSRLAGRKGISVRDLELAIVLMQREKVTEVTEEVVDG